MSPKLKPWLLLGGIFVIGVVTGSALTIGLAPRFLHPPQGAHNMRANWMDRLTNRLHLTPNQQAKIQPILADAETKFQALLHDERQHGSQIFKDADDQIEAILTPDQQVELKKMEAERERMFPGRHHIGQDDHQAPPPAPPPATDNPAH